MPKRKTKKAISKIKSKKHINKSPSLPIKKQKKVKSVLPDTSDRADTIKKEKPLITRRRQERQRQTIIQALKNGSTIVNACEQAGISRECFYEWMHDEKRNKEFIEAIDSALTARVRIVEDSLYTQAVKGNATCLIFWLCNRAQDRWQNVSKIDHTGTIDVNPLENLSKEELLQKFNELSNLIKSEFKKGK